MMKQAFIFAAGASALVRKQSPGLYEESGVNQYVNVINEADETAPMQEMRSFKGLAPDPQVTESEETSLFEWGARSTNASTADNEAETTSSTRTVSLNSINDEYIVPGCVPFDPKENGQPCSPSNKCSGGGFTRWVGSSSCSKCKVVILKENGNVCSSSNKCTGYGPANNFCEGRQQDDGNGGCNHLCGGGEMGYYLGSIGVCAKQGVTKEMCSQCLSAPTYFPVQEGCTCSTGFEDCCNCKGRGQKTLQNTPEFNGCNKYCPNHDYYYGEKGVCSKLTLEQCSRPAPTSAPTPAPTNAPTNAPTTTACEGACAKIVTPVSFVNGEDCSKNNKCPGYGPPTNYCEGRHQDDGNGGCNHFCFTGTGGGGEMGYYLGSIGACAKEGVTADFCKKCLHHEHHDDDDAL